MVFSLSKRMDNPPQAFKFGLSVWTFGIQVWGFPSDTEASGGRTRRARGIGYREIFWNLDPVWLSPDAWQTGAPGFLLNRFGLFTRGFYFARGWGKTERKGGSFRFITENYSETSKNSVQVMEMGGTTWTNSAIGTGWWETFRFNQGK